MSTGNIPAIKLVAAIPIGADNAALPVLCCDICPDDVRCAKAFAPGGMDSEIKRFHPKSSLKNKKLRTIARSRLKHIVAGNVGYTYAGEATVPLAKTTTVNASKASTTTTAIKILRFIISYP
jgi:hypothetical protein